MTISKKDTHIMNISKKDTHIMNISKKDTHNSRTYMYVLEL